MFGEWLAMVQDVSDEAGLRLGDEYDGRCESLPRLLVHESCLPVRLAAAKKTKDEA